MGLRESLVLYKLVGGSHGEARRSKFIPANYFADSTAQPD